MKNSLFVALVLVFSMTFFQTGLANNPIHQEPFHTINVAGNVRVILQKGEKEHVEFETEMYGTNVIYSKGILKIKRLKLTDRDETSVVRVTYKDIHSLKITSGAVLKSESVIQADHLDYYGSNGSDGEIEIEVKSLTVQLITGSTLEIKGVSNSQNIQLGTGSEYLGFQLDCNYTYVKASSGSVARVVAKELIDTRSSLGGDVYYEGNPKETNTKTVLGGDASKN